MESPTSTDTHTLFMDKERLEIAAIHVHETSGLVTSDVHTEDTPNYFEDYS